MLLVLFSALRKQLSLKLNIPITIKDNQLLIFGSKEKLLDHIQRNILNNSLN